MSGKPNQPKHLFTVGIDLDLPQENLDRIKVAIQRAVLDEVVGIDTHGDFRSEFDIRGRIGGGHTDGIWIREVAALN